MAGNTLTLEFAGDAAKLQKAAKQSSDAIDNVGKAAKSSSEEFEKSGKKSMDFNDKIGKLGAGVGGMTDAIDSASEALGALNDIQNQSYEKSQRQARALQDVAQAQQDANQAVRDSRQAAIDAGQAKIDEEQANLDVTTSQKDYNKAVKEHGKNSSEARQALVDLHQAQQDVKQAQEDGKQATEDGKQATIDAKNAQLDLNDAQKDAHPTDLTKAIQDMQTFTPLLSGMVGIIGLVTAAQWLWNIAMDANPIGIVILAIGAIITIVVLLVKHWDWVKKVGAAAWDWIKKAAKNSWDFIKKIPGWIGDAFKSIGRAILAPFRTAFNGIADAWNNTIGRLSWSVPNWIPGIGGHTISVPHLPKFHSGGTVPGAPGSEMLAVLQAGETVTPAGGGNGEPVHVVVQIDRDVLVDAVTKGYRGRFGHA